MTLLKVSDISKAGLGNFKLQGITFSQRKNKKIALAGETGSGKSTVLKIIAGLEQADRGEVIFKTKIVRGPAENLVPGHPGIAYLSQDYELPKFLRVAQILSYANILNEEEANTLFDVCEISNLLERKTDELSGGERDQGCSGARPPARQRDARGDLPRSLGEDAVRRRDRLPRWVPDLRALQYCRRTNQAQRTDRPWEDNSRRSAA